jgi:uncharacterized protein (DUF1015 family)
MSVIRPFRGLRPKPELAKKVASPPYDVLSSDEARAMVKDNPDSFLRVNKSEVDFPAETSLYSDEIYRRGKENLDRLVNDAIMIRDDSPCFYLYRLTWKGRGQTGIVCLTSVEEYDQGKIKKHEHTRPSKVKDRANHIVALGAQVGPVLSIFKNRPQIAETFGRITAAAPEVDFLADDDVQHQLWPVSDKANIDALTNDFAALHELYIADGHHRSQSASEVCRRMTEANPAHTGQELYNFFLNVVFPDDQLRILPYNRVVRDLNSLTRDGLLEKAAKSFEIQDAAAPVSPDENDHRVGFYCNGKWGALKAKAGTFDNSKPSESIDAAILYENLLRPVLGIEDIRTDERIDFIGGIRGTAELVRLVDSDTWKIAFSLGPVTVEQLLAVADAGEVMPPKSTWFEPKLRSGMVINLLND